MQYQNVLDAVFGTPWAIRPEMYQTICAIVRARAEGERLTDDEIQARIGAAPVRPGAARNGSVAVLPLYGVVSQRMNLVNQTSGGTSTELFGRAFQDATRDPGISAIVIDVDSPGGHVFGVEELWQTIISARGSKPIVAVANSTAASSAYWIVSAADEIVVTPSGQVGSIGVIAEHIDQSIAMEQAGLKSTLITAGKKKAQLAPSQPLSDDARADIQDQVNSYYAKFVHSVARGRGVPVATVRDGFGEGGMVLAQDAVRMGMVDRIGTLDQTIARLLGQGTGGRGMRAVSVPAQSMHDVPETWEDDMRRRRALLG